MTISNPAIYVTGGGGGTFSVRYVAPKDGALGIESPSGSNFIDVVQGNSYDLGEFSNGTYVMVQYDLDEFFSPSIPIWAVQMAMQDGNIAIVPVLL